MNKPALLGQRAYFQQVHGVTLRLIAAFDEKDLDYRPAEGARTVRDLITHIYAMQQTMSEGIRAGKLTADVENRSVPETLEGQQEIARLTSTGKLIEYARACFQFADATLAQLTEEQLQKQIETPWGTFVTWQLFSFMYDEHWHHRGQLYVYARLLGRKTPMIYDYEGNAAATA